MPKRKGIRKAFMAWLDKNRDRFIAGPFIIDIQKCCVNLGFVGIRPEIGATIQYGRRYGCISVYLMYRGRSWDLLADYDVGPTRRSSGDHYCELCPLEKRRLFRSRRELLSDHLFEPLLKWVNEHLIPSRWICLFASCGATWAKTIDVGRIRSDKDFKQLVDAFPVGACMAVLEGSQKLR